MGVKVFDQESRQEVEVFCDNDPLMPEDLLPFEALTGPDRCDEYLLDNRTIDRKHPDHVCGLTALESVNRFRASLYGEHKWRLPARVRDAWPMPIGAASIQAFASRRGVDPLSMLPALTEQGDAWLALVVRVPVLQAEQPVGWVRLYGLVERVESDPRRGTVWEFGAPRVTVEYSQPFKTRADPAADTARVLWAWHTKNVLHSRTNGPGRPAWSGNWDSPEHFLRDLEKAFRKHESHGRVANQRGAATQEIITGHLGIADVRHLKRLLDKCGVTWKEAKTRFARTN